jgi:hypothetical protein
MTHVPNRRNAVATLATVIATAIAIAAGAIVAPASARTFDFNSVGSMVQRPLPPQWVRCT